MSYRRLSDREINQIALDDQQAARDDPSGSVNDMPDEWFFDEGEPIRWGKMLVIYVFYLIVAGSICMVM